LETVPAALLRVQTLPNGTQIGRFRYGDRYLLRQEAVALDPFQLPLAKEVFKFTQLKGIPGAVRDAGPDAWGRRVIETSSNAARPTSKKSTICCMDRKTGQGT
jgi:serine/threonine-protein kinase HipA